MPIDFEFQQGLFCILTNCQTYFVLGIVLAVLSLIGCGNGSNGIIKGIIDVIIHCVLVFGAHTRNSTAILVWMVLAILSCIGYAILTALVVVAAGAAGAEGEAVGFAVVWIVFMIGSILFEIWTITVAMNARKEIEAGEGAKDLYPSSQLEKSKHDQELINMEEIPPKY